MSKILMPALSPTMEEGTLAKWHVKVGDEVKSGDILAEIETDKATMEFEAVDEGRISKILVAEGTEGVKVNAPIAELDGEGGDNSSDESAKAASAPAPSAPMEGAPAEVAPENEVLEKRSPIGKSTTLSAPAVIIPALKLSKEINYRQLIVSFFAMDRLVTSLPDDVT